MTQRLNSFSVSVLAMCFLGPASASAFSEATHAYIADHLGKRVGAANSNELYGAMAADLFNLDFELVENAALQACVRSTTHGSPLTQEQGFMEFWRQKPSGFATHAAYGYVSHNDVWGADSFAHWTSANGQAPGYIVARASQLMNAIHNQKDIAGLSPWDHLGIPPGSVVSADPLADPALLLSHYFLERAGDLLIKRQDPSIGFKVAAAAASRSPEFATLTAEVFSSCSLSSSAALQTETDFREQTFTYGLLLLGSESDVLRAVQTKLLLSAPTFYEAFTHKPFNAALWPYVEQIVSYGLSAGLTLVEPDFMSEVSAVIQALPARMTANGVSY